MNQITFKLKGIDLDKAGDILIESGALSATIENEAESNSPENTWFDEPGHPKWEQWGTPVLKALIQESMDGKTLAKLIQNEFGLSSPPSFTLESVPSKNWVQETQKINKPIQLDRKLWIIPTHHIPPDKNATNIFLDPGESFGSGTHTTTQLCLRWLSENIKGGESVLDFGCGSGILAIAASKLGAASVIGTDIDPHALDNTQENAKRNGVKIHVFQPEDYPGQKVDILVANILANPLKELSEQFHRYLNEGGKIALSGLMASQVETVLSSYTPLFTNLQVKEEGIWALITGILRV